MIKNILLAITSIITTFANAATPIDGWYSSVFGGYTYLPGNVDVNTYGLSRSNARYQAGFDAGGSLGFKSNPLRYEGELTYLRANIKKFDINRISQTAPTGFGEAALGLANVYYDFPGITAPIQPYLGAGIGYAWVKSSLNTHSGPLGITDFNGSNSVFAYQATGGLTYNFAENYALNVGYRYVATTHADELGQLFQAHLANLGAIYRFDGNQYK